MTDRFVHDERERCLAFVTEHSGLVVANRDWYQALGVERDGELIAAVVYTLMTECDISMHVAAMPGKRWLSRAFLELAFQYPFTQLGLRRVSAFVPSTNAAALNLNKHLGFVEEGRMRDAVTDGDVIVLGMLKKECRWHGQEVQSSAAA